MRGVMGRARLYELGARGWGQACMRAVAQCCQEARKVAVCCGCMLLLDWSARRECGLTLTRFPSSAPSALLPSPYSHFTLHPPLSSGTRLVRASSSEDASSSSWPADFKLRLPTGDADLAAFTQVVTIIVTLVAALGVALSLRNTMHKVRQAEDKAEKRRLGKTW